MKVVVDASVFICIILNEPEKQKIITVTEGAELVSPHTIPRITQITTDFR
jgi:uncharacterized protein with PIN domain